MEHTQTGRPRRLLITGGTGYLGSNLIPFLKQRWQDVEILMACRNAQLAKQRLPGTDFITELNPEEIARFDPQAVIHLAGFITASDATEELDNIIEGNFTYGVRLLDSLKNCKSLRLVLNIGSCTQYQEGNLKSAYLYSAVKTAFMAMLDFYGDKYKIKCPTAVLYSIYGGKFKHGKALNYIYDSIDSGQAVDMSPGYQKIDYIHINDVCDFIATLLEKEHVVEKNEIFHVGSGQSLTLREIAALVEQIGGCKCNINWGGLEYRRGDIMYSCCPQDPNMIRLGWKPKIKLRDGLEEKINHHH